MNYFRFFSCFLFTVIFAVAFFSGNVFAADNEILSVTQISAVKTYAIADGTFENGWQWIFDVTVPYNETILKMKFNDWANGSNLIAATDNIRFYSAQSANANSAASAIMITSAGEYSLPMNIIPQTSSDLDFAKTGRQIKIIAEVRVPKGSAGGSYSTSYGIFTDIDGNIEISDPEQSFIEINPGSELSNQIVLEEGEGFDAVDFHISASGSTMQVDQIILEFNDDPRKYFGSMIISISEQATRERLIEQKDIAKIDENKYALTIWTDFSVSENTVRRLRVRLVTKNYVNSTQMPVTFQIGLPAQGVRAFDRFGNYHYSDAPLFFRNVIINRSYAGEAEIILSKNVNSPSNRNIVADSNQEIDEATLMTFNLKANKDDLIVDEINDVVFGGTKIPNTAYVVDDGGNIIGTISPSATAGDNDFTELDYTIPKDTTKTLSIKIDDTVAAPNSDHESTDDGKTYIVTINTGKVGFTKSNGTTDTSTGSATSNAAYVYAEGPEFTLTNITTADTQASYSGDESSMSATFSIQVRAVNGDVYLGNSGAFMVESKIGNATSTSSVADVTYVQPSNTMAEGSAYKISEGNMATFVVNATVSNGGIAGTYDLRIAGVKWGHLSNAPTSVTSSYMNGDAAWISPAVYLR